MPRRLFDTNFLIGHWRRFPEDTRERTPDAMREWARELIGLHGTKLICTPVLIEMFAGTTNAKELELHRAYLGEFDVIDGRKLPASVWDSALRLAQHVPSNSSIKRRHLGDCLIRSVADHFHCEVLTGDKAMRRLPR
jgi:predicted nucleic acid-binding protein